MWPWSFFESTGLFHILLFVYDERYSDDTGRLSSQIDSYLHGIKRRLVLA